MRIAFYAMVLLAVSATHGVAEPPITAVALSSDGQQVLLGSQRGVEVRTWPEMEFVRSVATQLANVHDLKFSPDGLLLLVAGGSPAESGRVEVWDWSSVVCTRELAINEDLIYRVAWSPDGSQWVGCGGEGRCAVFATSTAARLTDYDGHSRAVLSVGYLDAENIVSVSADQTIRLWSSSSGTHLRTLDNHVGTVNDVGRQVRERQAASWNAASEDCHDQRGSNFAIVATEDWSLGAFRTLGIGA